MFTLQLTFSILMSYEQISKSQIKLTVFMPFFFCVLCKPCFDLDISFKELNVQLDKFFLQISQCCKERAQHRGIIRRPSLYLLICLHVNMNISLKRSHLFKGTRDYKLYKQLQTQFSDDLFHASSMTSIMSFCESYFGLWNDVRLIMHDICNSILNFPLFFHRTPVVR